MERDFLGLNWKEESSDIYKNSVSEVEESPYPSKLASSSPPQIMPLKLASMVLPAYSSDYINTKPPFPKTDAWTAAPTLKQQQSIGGIKSVVPNPFSMCPNNGYTNNVAKLSGPNAPLTIFYSGAVRVYHDISPEKAEAIMRTAGNGSSETKQISRPGELIISRNQPQLPPNNGAVYPAQNSTETLIAGAIPMARKATLARFLEKRKARLIDGMPYNVSRKVVDSITLPAT